MTSVAGVQNKEKETQNADFSLIRKLTIIIFYIFHSWIKKHGEQEWFEFAYLEYVQCMSLLDLG